MDIFNDNDLDSKNSLDLICEQENNEIFILVVALISMLNKKFYSPVAFLIEYYNNKGLQRMTESLTGMGYSEFIILFLKSFPTVIKSRKLKSVVTNEQ